MADFGAKSGWNVWAVGKFYTRKRGKVGRILLVKKA